MISWIRWQSVIVYKNKLSKLNIKIRWVKIIIRKEDNSPDEPAAAYAINRPNNKGKKTMMFTTGYSATWMNLRNRTPPLNVNLVLFQSWVSDPWRPLAPTSPTTTTAEATIISSTSTLFRESKVPLHMHWTIKTGSTSLTRTISKKSTEPN